MWRSISTLLRPQEAYLTADNDYHQTSSSSTPISFSHSPSPVNLIPTGLHDPKSLFTRTNKIKNKTKQKRIQCQFCTFQIDNRFNPVNLIPAYISSKYRLLHMHCNNFCSFSRKNNAKPGNSYYLVQFVNRTGSPPYLQSKDPLYIVPSHSTVLLHVF